MYCHNLSWSPVLHGYLMSYSKGSIRGTHWEGREKCMHWRVLFKGPLQLELLSAFDLKGFP